MLTEAARRIGPCIAFNAVADDRQNEVLTHVGDKVRFSVDDIFLPNAESVFVAAPGEVEVHGTVVNFSDSGHTPRMFALVEVVRRQTVVVPIEKLQPLPSRSP